MDLDGKVVVVAGSGRGTGRVIAIEAARRGARVVTCARTGVAAESVAQEIRDGGGQAAAVMADLSVPAQAGGLIGRAVALFGHVDALIYNAARETLASFTRIDEQDWNATLATNLTGYLLSAQATARHRIGLGGGGSIVGIASVTALTGYTACAAYGASKAGMIGLTKSMAVDLGKHRIRANCVAPGWIDSDALAAGLDRIGEDGMTSLRRRTSLGRFADPLEVAKAAIFLASGDASYSTGSVVTVDGGMSLGNVTVRT
jgi:NAD(P)-dependent dehydrogenase (short-subunit alcohol dehydrogenase family)